MALHYVHRRLLMAAPSTNIWSPRNTGGNDSRDGDRRAQMQHQRPLRVLKRAAGGQNSALMQKNGWRDSSMRVSPYSCCKSPP